MCATLAISKIGALIDTRVIAFLQDFKVIKYNRIKEMTATNLAHFFRLLFLEDGRKSKFLSRF